MVSENKKKPVPSERVVREKEELLSAPPQIDIERVKFLLEVYEKTVKG